MLKSYPSKYLQTLSTLIVLLFSSSLSWAQINTFPYLEDFETSNGGWVAGSIAPGGGASSWVWATPANPIITNAASGINCWITGNASFVFPPLEPFSYAPGEMSAVVSPFFDFTNLVNPGIMMNIWWESEFQIDGTVLQTSVDSGMTWQTVGNYLDNATWYNDSSILSLPGGVIVGWTGDTTNSFTGSNGWISAQHALDNLAGEPDVLLRFAFASDANVDPLISLMDGFAFDDVLIADMPVVDLGPDTVLCFADSLSIGACFPTTNFEYQWNTNPLDTLCELLAVATDRYVLAVTDSFGFIVRDTIDIYVSPTFVNFGGDQLICPGDTVFLNAFNNTAVSYEWTPNGEITSGIDVTQSGQYKVTVLDNVGCVESDSINIFVDLVPDIDLGSDTAICAGSSLILDAGAGNPGTTYSWSPILASTQTVFIASPDTYSVVVTTPANCVVSDTIVIDVSLFPVVELGDDGPVCDSVILDASNPGSTYLWSTSDTTQTYTATTAGTYNVTVTNAAGCSSSDTISITIDSAPIVSLGPDTVVCDGQPITLDAGNPGLTYLWSTGATTQTIPVSSPGRYVVRVTNSSNCTGRDTIEVSRSTLNVDLGADRELCTGDSLQLDAGPVGETYAWSTTEDTRFIFVTQPGSYSVTVTDTLGCVVTDDISITTVPGPTPTFDYTGDTLLFSPIQFNGDNPGATIAWLWDFGDGNTASSQTASHAYASTGTFTVCLTATDALCSRTICEELVITLPTNITDLEGASLDVYPNPAQEAFQIGLTLPFQADIAFTLMDLAGRKIEQQTYNQQQVVDTQMQVQQLSGGLYVLAIDIDGQRFHVKVEVQ